MSDRPLTESLWWIIPERLSGMRKPTPEEVPMLQNMGIDAIVSVMDDPSNLDLYQHAGLPYRWLPTTGGKAPTPEQIEEFVQFVDDQNAQSHGVVVHCSSGRRRTGTFLAAYLIKTGRSVEQALAIIEQSNPLVELREAQVSFLQSLKA